MNKILSYIICATLIGGLFTPMVQADLCGSESGFEIYKCRVENICEEYKSPKPVYNSQEYEIASEATLLQQDQSSPILELEAAKELYRENMGNIYKCGIVQSQINALERLKEFLSGDASGSLGDTVGGQIDLRINRLDISANTIGCTLSDDETVQNKLNLLKETTHQACKHVSYLEYLKTFYEKTNNLYSNQEAEEIYGTNIFNDIVTPQEISNQINTRKNAVANEISQTYKVFPIAYQAYTEYENNFPIHFLLEVIRADFMILRQNLYETLMPIAQLGLKIINAMSY